MFEKLNNINYDYIYCITSYICNGIKIDYWKGTINSLLKRYITYYCNDIDIFMYIHLIQRN